MSFPCGMWGAIARSDRRWHTFDQPTADDTCRQFVIPADENVLAAIGGALSELTKPYNWQQVGNMTPEEAAEFFSALLLAYYESECGTGDVDAPFWDDTDGENADDTVEPEFTETWYETASWWILKAFVATAVTPEAAIIYVSTLRRLHIAFRVGGFGGLVRVLLDGIEVANIDTYAAGTPVFQYMIDTGDDESHTLRLEHTGEANPLAEVDPVLGGYRMDVIRKHLGVRIPTGDEILTEYDEATDEVQISIDGGETWIDAPGSDPRRITRLPPRITGATTCDAAQGMADAYRANIEAMITQMQLSGLVANLMSVIITPMARFAGAYAVLFTQLVLNIANVLLTYGATAIETAFDEDFWDKLPCLILPLLNAQGQISAAGLERLKLAIDQEEGGTVGVISQLVLSYWGEGGLNDQNAVSSSVGDCDECCLNYIDQMIGSLGWRTFISEFSAIQLEGNDGSYVSSGGHASGGGYILGTVQSNGARAAAVMIDMGRECAIQSLRFWVRRPVQNGNINRQIRVYNSSFVTTYSENTAVNSGANIWAEYHRFIGLATGRYVAVYVDANAVSSQVHISDFEVTVS